jgi:hypothetical protein
MPDPRSAFALRSQSEYTGACAGEDGHFAHIARRTDRAQAARAFFKDKSLHCIWNYFWEVPMGIGTVYGMPYDMMHQFELGTCDWCLKLSLELVEHTHGKSGLKELDRMARKMEMHHHNDHVLPVQWFRNGLLNKKGKLRPTLNASERAPALVVTLLCIAELLGPGGAGAVEQGCNDEDDGDGDDDDDNDADDDGAGKGGEGAEHSADDARGAAGDDEEGPKGSENWQRPAGPACVRCIYRYSENPARVHNRTGVHRSHPAFLCLQGTQVLAVYETRQVHQEKCHPVQEAGFPHVARLPRCVR